MIETTTKKKIRKMVEQGKTVYGWYEVDGRMVYFGDRTSPQSMINDLVSHQMLPENYRNAEFVDMAELILIKTCDRD